MVTSITDKLNMGVKLIPAVVCFCVKDNKVLLGHRKKVSLGLGQDVLGGIGGKVGDDEENKNELPEEALVREVLEEVGIRLTKYSKVGRVRFIYENKPKWNMDVLVYIGHDWEGVPQETDVIRPEWFSLEAMPYERMWGDNKHWVPRILQGDTLDEIYLLDDNSEVLEHLVM